MIYRAVIVAEAREWIGTPYIHGQSLKGVGCDCIGLIAGVAGALGMPEAEAWKHDVRFKGYTRQPSPEKLVEACEEYLDPIALASVELADIIVYTMRFAVEPMHFGIVSADDPRYIIHSYERAGKVVENGAQATFWRPLRAYRYRGVS